MRKSEEMVERLKKCNAPDLCGYVERPGQVFFVEPPPKFSPTHYTVDDLRKAVNAGLLDKRKFNGSMNFEFYGLPLGVLAA
jgi:hypothetical protein